MSKTDGMREKKCGCIIFDVGPPVPCTKHATQAKRKEEREQRRTQREQKKEERGLRKIVAEQAFNQGHDLSKFKEYPSLPGKWTAWCHTCGALVIVYDRVPERGDQIAGKAVFQPCGGGSETFAVLRDCSGVPGIPEQSDAGGDRPELAESEQT